VFYVGPVNPSIRLISTSSLPLSLSVETLNRVINLWMSGERESRVYLAYSGQHYDLRVFSTSEVKAASAQEKDSATTLCTFVFISLA